MGERNVNVVQAAPPEGKPMKRNGGRGKGVAIFQTSREWGYHLVKGGEAHHQEIHEGTIHIFHLEKGGRVRREVGKSKKVCCTFCSQGEEWGKISFTEYT